LEIAAKLECELETLHLRLNEQNLHADRLQSQLHDRENYISRLPTIDEVAKTKQQVRAIFCSFPSLNFMLFPFSDGRGQRRAREAQGADQGAREVCAQV